jgi:hypothetical protein
LTITLSSAPLFCGTVVNCPLSIVNCSQSQGVEDHSKIDGLVWRRGYLGFLLPLPFFFVQGKKMYRLYR